jgi:hypothetical protein
MYQWDKYTKEQRERLVNLQIAREDEWKNDMLVKFEQQDLEHNTVFNDVVDEHAIWFRDAVVKYLEQVIEEAEQRSRLPEWLHQVFNLGPDRLSYIVVRSAMEMTYVSAVGRDSNPHLNTWALPLAQAVGRDIADKCWDVAAWLSAREAEPFFYRHQSKYFKNWNPKRRRAFTKISNKRESVTKRTYVTLPSEMVQFMMTRIEDYAARLLPNRLPMVCRPVVHTHSETGGMMDWSIRKLRHTTQLKQRPDEDTDNERVVDPSCMSDMTRKVINTLQATEWRINERVLDVANELWRSVCTRLTSSSRSSSGMLTSATSGAATTATPTSCTPRVVTLIRR